MACNIVLPLSMQQPAATKPQQEQCLCFSFVIGSTDPAPAIGGAFCMSCGHRHKSGPWQPCTVVVDEDLTVLVKASGRTVLPSGIGHSLKQQNVMSSLSLRKDDILELQRKCKPGEYVYPRLVGRHKTAVCSASYQRIGQVHALRPSSRPSGPLADPASLQEALMPPLHSGAHLAQLQEVTQQLEAEKQKHKRTGDMLAAEQQLHTVTRQKLLDAHQQYVFLNADVERLLRQLDQCEAQNTELQQKQKAVL